MIHTIGHSTRTIEEFIALLKRAGVEVVCDVRRYPGSRRQPQFGRDALRAALQANGVEYVHEPRLGGRREPLDDSPNTFWRNRSFRGYADHMSSTEFRQALDALIELGSQRRAVIMCAEAVPWQCHRNLIADALVARGVEVHHIVGAGEPTVHTLNAAARIRAGGSVNYEDVRPQGSLFES